MGDWDELTLLLIGGLYYVTPFITAWGPPSFQVKTRSFLCFSSTTQCIWVFCSSLSNVTCYVLFFQAHSWGGLHIKKNVFMFPQLQSKTWRGPQNCMFDAWIFSKNYYPQIMDLMVKKNDGRIREHDLFRTKFQKTKDVGLALPSQ